MDIGRWARIEECEECEERKRKRKRKRKRRVAERDGQNLGFGWIMFHLVSHYLT
jgi:hypothetical protein